MGMPTLAPAPVIPVPPILPLPEPEPEVEPVAAGLAAPLLAMAVPLDDGQGLVQVTVELAPLAVAVAEAPEAPEVPIGIPFPVELAAAPPLGLTVLGSTNAS